jgi:hypothetical protein
VKARGGYAAILSVLIMGAAALAVSLALLTTGTDAMRSAATVQLAVAARAMARSCAEEALQQIHDNSNYTGSGSFGTAPDYCTYTVTSTGSSTRSIVTTGFSGDVVKKMQINATIGVSSISITSWQEV